jgi:hypothetical protein
MNRALPAIAIDDNGLSIAVAVTIMIFSNDDGLVTGLTFANDFALAIAIVTSGANRYADARGSDADTHSDFLRARRHRETNSSRRNGHYRKTLDHCMLLSV